MDSEKEWTLVVKKKHKNINLASSASSNSTTPSTYEFIAIKRNKGQTKTYH